MQATKQLPANYQLHKTLDLGQKRWTIGLNVLTFPLFALFGWLFIRIVALIHPPFGCCLNAIIGDAMSSIAFLLSVAGGVVAIIVLHELVHGLFFWMFTRERPTFGFKGLYAFAGAPAWHLPRNQMLLVTLAPLLLLSLVGILAIPFASLSLALGLILMMSFNAAGAVGDLVSAVWLLAQPGSVLVRDNGTALTTFQAALL